jgi:hypothetical protein
MHIGAGQATIEAERPLPIGFRWMKNNNTRVVLDVIKSLHHTMENIADNTRSNSFTPDIEIGDTMRKISLFLFAAVTLGLLASFTNVRASSILDPEVQHVGLVVAYTPDQSITIVDKNGDQFTFTIATPLKIVPAHRADMLGPGAYVTIISSNNVPGGKWIATGVVIHPHAPSSFILPTATVIPTDTPTEVSSETPVATEVPTETMTATETPTAVETSTETATPTAVETSTETVTPTATAVETATTTSASQLAAQPVIVAFLEWLKSFFS